MRGCAVARVLGWRSPEGFLSAPLFASLLGSLIEHVRHALVAPEERRSDLVARNPLQIVDNRGSKFQVVPIRIDYRMVQAIMKRFRFAIARHDISPFPRHRPSCEICRYTIAAAVEAKRLLRHRLRERRPPTPGLRSWVRGEAEGSDQVSSRAAPIGVRSGFGKESEVERQPRCTAFQTPELCGATRETLARSGFDCYVTWTR